MTTLVLGAGVIGVTSAYYLAKAGHKVIVVDRQPGPALETSFANGGQISACHTEPWATPATLPKVMKWLGRKDAPLKFRLKADPELWSWCLRFLMNCSEARTLTNIERMLRIALYSRDSLVSLRNETGIEYDQLSKGILHIYRDEQELAAATKRAYEMNQLGLDRRALNVAECAELEPALKTASNNRQICGGLYSPGDESGDAYTFTKALADLATGLDVEFRYDCSINHIKVKNGRFMGIDTDKGFFEATTCIVALGSYSTPLLKPHGIHLPIYPAKGYSITLPVSNEASAPSVSLIQDELKLVYSRLGDRLRVAGTAEIAGYNDYIDEYRAGNIMRAALELFPDINEPDNPEFWAGLRPKTPDSAPILGETKIENLHLNTGHGTLGWTMACGSGKVLADLISGKQPEIDLNGLKIDRFS